MERTFNIISSLKKLAVFMVEASRKSKNDFYKISVVIFS